MRNSMDLYTMIETLMSRVYDDIHEIKQGSNTKHLKAYRLAYRQLEKLSEHLVLDAEDVYTHQKNRVSGALTELYQRTRGDVNTLDYSKYHEAYLSAYDDMITAGQNVASLKLE